MNGPRGVLVVGASAAGLATAEALRRGGYTGTLTLLGAERHLPYDRPPLSKHVLGGQWEAGRTGLREPEALAALGAEFVLADPAVALDPEARTVLASSGRRFRAESVVIATGLRARTLPGQDTLAGVHVLRTLDDALALRAALPPGARLVVVGDGVLGSEIAATACGMGACVTLVGPQPAPMASQLGPDVAGLLAGLHLERGVRLRSGAGVCALVASAGRVAGVRLDTGETLPADVVVVAIGASPATEWLSGSGLRTQDGVVCDSRLRAADGIYAAGDVARWHHDALGSLVRLENRTNATEQALAVANVILGDERPYRPVPYFWTDQFDARIQVYGRPASDADISVVEGEFAARRFVAVYRRAGTVTGVLGWNMPKQARLHRQLVVGAYEDLTPAQ